MNLWPAIRMSEAIRRAEKKERELAAVERCLCPECGAEVVVCKHLRVVPDTTKRPGGRSSA